MTTSKKSVIDQLAKVPNVGETIAKSAYETLGVRSVADLIQAGESGKLQSLEGIGKKKAKAILEAAREARPNGKAHVAAMLDRELGSKMREALGDERVLEMYREMLLIRRFEEQAGRQYQMGKIKGFCHLYIGQEAVAVGSLSAARDDDHVVAAYREHGHALARGISANEVMAELFGKETGVSGGKGGSMHIFDVERNFWGGWGIVGGHIPTAAGMAFASKYRGEDRVTLCYFGDGSVHQGVVHETMNMAALWDLPLVLIIENNHYAMGTALERASSITDLSKKGAANDIRGVTVDGQDVFAVYDAVGDAIERARTNHETTLLDVKTYRYRGHSMSDPAKYRSKEEVQEEEQVGPLVRFHAWIHAEGLATEEELDQWDDEAKSTVKEAVKFANDSDFPDPSTLTDHVYVEWDWDIE